MWRNICLKVAYDGTDFHGWQRQPGQRTVQESLEHAIRRVVGHPLNVIGSGRTDAGVHASGQVANFRTTCRIPAENLRKAISSRLPRDISIWSIREVPMAFHASFHATAKMYRYSIYNDPHRPVEWQRQKYVYHCWHDLVVERMRAGARWLVGEHDFAAFASSGQQRRTTVRTVLSVEIHRVYQEIRCEVVGTGFLYNQVRNMVGTLIEVGRGHWEPQRVQEILDSRDRSQAGATAPAAGLCLMWVRYDLTQPFEPFDWPGTREGEIPAESLESPLIGPSSENG